ncbi:hypothetical protein HRR76_002749 [Exophiala dermatitidis]|nr:hypothetical protein HRR74_009395 [Exophiala dermatitidis]KAJ4544701.1 hypothetical protein HRR76_002749 [Exophiala dermatitidis]
MAVLSACFLCAGVLRHYWDIYTERTVRGISFIFVGIDAMGDLTSLISVFFQPELDILGMVIYGSELALWLGVFACGGYFNLRPWLHRRLEKRGSETARREVSVREGSRDEPVELQPISSRNSVRSSSSVFRTASATDDCSSRADTSIPHGLVRLRRIASDPAA